MWVKQMETKFQFCKNWIREYGLGLQPHVFPYTSLNCFSAWCLDTFTGTENLCLYKLTAWRSKENTHSEGKLPKRVSRRYWIKCFSVFISSASKKINEWFIETISFRGVNCQFLALWDRAEMLKGVEKFYLIAKCILLIQGRKIVQ